MFFLWLGVAVIVLLCFAFGLAYYCYRRIFYSPPRKLPGAGEYEIPEGEIYEVFRENMIAWTEMLRNLPHENVSITSYDGLTLRGKYYEYEKGAPLELLFHGYRGYAERDLSAAVERCFAIGRNALLIDQRASGESDGNVITFGVKERLDCLKWIDFAIEHFGKDVKILIGGVSMGASTVLMTAGEKLPKNVVCIMADCGFTSAKEMIQKVIRDMKLPAQLIYPFVKMGARVFGKFNLEETSAIECVEKATLPIIFIHGAEDYYVPFEMSRRMYELCPSKKALAFIDGAGHGLAYPVNKEAYLQALRDFEKQWKTE